MAIEEGSIAYSTRYDVVGKVWGIVVAPVAGDPDFPAEDPIVTPNIPDTCQFSYFDDRNDPHTVTTELTDLTEWAVVE